VYHEIPVLDVHGHVSVPLSANSFAVLMIGSNTPTDSPISQQAAAPAQVSLEDFQLAAGGHRDVNDMIHQQCTFFPHRFLGACPNFGFLSEDDRKKIFNENHAMVVPGLVKIGR
jgi:hypothetical protein